MPITFFTCGDLHVPSPNPGLRRDGESESNRLISDGVPLCALIRRDPGATVIMTSGPLPAPARSDHRATQMVTTDAGAVCW